MRHAGFMPEVQDFQPPRRRHGKHLVQMVANKRENTINAQLFAGVHK